MHSGHEERKPAMVRWLLSVLVLAFALPVSAGLRTGGDFLKIPIGAEGASLGQAYTASSEGVDALNWNPAGLSSVPAYLDNPSVGLSLSHQEYLVDNNLDHFGMVLAPDAVRRTAVGLNVVRLSYGTQERRTTDRQRIGTFDSYDLSVGLSAARRISGFSLGGQFKLIREQLAGFSAIGYAVDMGVQGPGPFNRMTFGLAVQNLGPRMVFVQESFQLPLTISGGMSYKVTGPLSVLMDVRSRPYQNQLTVDTGVEFNASKTVALRAGYLQKISEAVRNSQASETNRGNMFGMAGLAAGLGMHFKQISLDYAITPFGELGNAQTLTISTWFGTGRKAVPVRDLEDVESSETNTEDDGQRLILPLEHERWWDDMR
ncbi:MAG: PorV/PorQ family protein [Elusimicrobia bacterium]|nr:PorV/PorQ family protein [Elusimicrobiota bacterium]